MKQTVAMAIYITCVCTRRITGTICGPVWAGPDNNTPWLIAREGILEGNGDWGEEGTKEHRLQGDYLRRRRWRLLRKEDKKEVEERGEEDEGEGGKGDAGDGWVLVEGKTRGRKEQRLWNTLSWWNICRRGRQERGKDRWKRQQEMRVVRENSDNSTSIVIASMRRLFVWERKRERVGGENWEERSNKDSDNLTSVYKRSHLNCNLSLKQISPQLWPHQWGGQSGLRFWRWIFDPGTRCLPIVTLKRGDVQARPGWGWSWSGWGWWPWLWWWWWWWKGWSVQGGLHRDSNDCQSKAEEDDNGYEAEHDNHCQGGHDKVPGHRWEGWFTCTETV